MSARRAPGQERLDRSSYDDELPLQQERRVAVLAAAGDELAFRDRDQRRQVAERVEETLLHDAHEVVSALSRPVGPPDEAGQLCRRVPDALRVEPAAEGGQRQPSYVK